jgi:hypothetical protein
VSVLLVSRAIRRASWTAALGAAAALAALLVSGHLLFCGLAYGVAVAYAGCLALDRLLTVPPAVERAGRLRRVRETLLGLALVVIGPLSLAAVVLWPTVLFLLSLGRENLPYQLIHESTWVPYRTFRFLVIPPPLPVTAATMHQMAFVGVLPALLAGVGFFRRGHGTMLARVLLVVVFLVATNTLLLRLVYAVLPQFSYFSPLGRLLNLFGFGVAVLAGIGFDAVVAKVPSRPAAAVVGAGIILFTAWQLVDYGRRINPPFVPRQAQYLYPETPLIQALKLEGAANGTASGRIFPVRQSQQHGWTPPMLFANESMLFGIDSAGGYDSTLPARSETLWRIVSGEDRQVVLNRRYHRAYLTSFEIDRVRFDLLPRLGITLIVGPPQLHGDQLWTPERYAPLKLSPIYSGADGMIFRIDGATGGPWVVPVATVVENAMVALERFSDPKFDATRSVLVERPDSAEGPAFTAAPHNTIGAARVHAERTNTLSVLATSSQPGWLVVPNTWDPGWRAWVNGRETKVLRANYAFQAVAIPAGESEVRLCYRPRGLLVGGVISALSVAAALAAGLTCAKRGRRSGGSERLEELTPTPDRASVRARPRESGPRVRNGS